VEIRNLILGNVNVNNKIPHRDKWQPDVWLRVWQALERYGKGTVKQIATNSGITKSSTQRVLKIMYHVGLVSQYNSKGQRGRGNYHSHPTATEAAVKQCLAIIRTNGIECLDNIYNRGSKPHAAALEVARLLDVKAVKQAKQAQRRLSHADRVLRADAPAWKVKAAQTPLDWLVWVCDASGIGTDGEELLDVSMSDIKLSSQMIQLYQSGHNKMPGQGAGFIAWLRSEYEIYLYWLVAVCRKYRMVWRLYVDEEDNDRLLGSRIHSNKLRMINNGAEGLRKYIFNVRDPWIDVDDNYEYKDHDAGVTIGMYVTDVGGSSE